MRYLLLLACWTVVWAAKPADWESFKTKFKKHYRNSEEESKRFSLYESNEKWIEQHNAMHNTSYRVNMNQFGDKTPEEVTSKLTGFSKAAQDYKDKVSGPSLQSPKFMAVPSEMDWRANGAVTPVEEQGECGSCWAFSAVSTCGYERSMLQLNISGYAKVRRGDERALQSAVGTVGPVSIGIHAGHPEFIFYSGGIFNCEGCNLASLDHAVLLVGYGTENGQDYWIIKNTWGTTWGEQGYMRLARNSNNCCGIASVASFPIL